MKENRYIKIYDEKNGDKGDAIMAQEIEEMIKNIREKTPRMAICYDFDKTLSPDDMQTFTLIPSLGMDNSEF